MKWRHLAGLKVIRPHNPFLSEIQRVRSALHPSTLKAIIILPSRSLHQVSPRRWRPGFRHRQQQRLVPDNRYVGSRQNQWIYQSIWINICENISEYQWISMKWAPHRDSPPPPSAAPVNIILNVKMVCIGIQKVCSFFVFFNFELNYR